MMTDEEIDKRAMGLDSGAFCHCRAKGRITCKRHKAVASLAKKLAAEVRAKTLEEAARVVEKWGPDGPLANKEWEYPVNEIACGVRALAAPHSGEPKP